MKKHKPVSQKPLLLTFICVAPFLHLITDIVEQEQYSRLLIDSFCAFPAIIIATIFWVFYFEDKDKST